VACLWLIWGADVTNVALPQCDPACWSLALHASNRGRRSVIADPQSEDGRGTIRRLAGVARWLSPAKRLAGETRTLDREALEPVR
jgi:crotonobetainyl-CoA:carnitine CoA-transferase CaiB-like acyl-CoA transferase